MAAISCYHPMLGVWNGKYTVTGKRKYEFTRKTYPNEDLNAILPPGFWITAPCGQCIGCRLDYSRRWADRMMLEREMHEDAVFVTLTYDDEHLPMQYDVVNGQDIPSWPTLVKKHVQDFMKRLRKYLNRDGIKFFCGGEYGEKYGRPHYHLILFGVGLSDFPDRCKIRGAPRDMEYYISSVFAQIWSFGYCLLAPVNWKTCAYVARYVVKKQRGQNALVYAERNQVPEFALMSRRPGLGVSYMDAHPELFQGPHINVGSGEDTKKVSIPDLFLRRLALTDPERADIIKDQRRQLAEDADFLRRRKSDLGFLEFLADSEQSKLDSVKKLKRDMRGKDAL